MWPLPVRSTCKQRWRQKCNARRGWQKEPWSLRNKLTEKVQVVGWCGQRGWSAGHTAYVKQSWWASSNNTLLCGRFTLQCVKRRSARLSLCVDVVESWGPALAHTIAEEGALASKHDVHIDIGFTIVTIVFRIYRSGVRVMAQWVGAWSVVASNIGKRTPQM